MDVERLGIDVGEVVASADAWDLGGQFAGEGGLARAGAAGHCQQTGRCKDQPPPDIGELPAPQDEHPAQKGPGPRSHIDYDDGTPCASSIHSALDPDGELIPRSGDPASKSP
jgi:hypothetical protein